MQDDYLSINVEYKFSSSVGSYDEYSCINNYTGILYAGEYADNSHNEYCGEIYFKIIYLSQAEAKGLDIYEMFDTYEYTFRHAQNFYDFKNDTFKKSLLKEFPDLEFGCSKICIIETIGIIPKFRGKNIGAKVFKDMVWHFGQECELFMLQPFPFIQVLKLANFRFSHTVKTPFFALTKRYGLKDPFLFKTSSLI